MDYYTTIRKEQNCPIYRDMNGSTECHTEWSKLEREKQIPYINTYVESSHEYLEMYQIFFEAQTLGL